MKTGWLLAATLVLAGTGVASAASTDVIFRGGAFITSTSGCTGWNPDKGFFIGTYWVPVAGSTNGPDSIINFLFGGGGGEGFQLNNGVFTTSFKPVDAIHIFTRNGTYGAFLKINTRAPAVISTTTKSVVLTGTVKGWDQVANCLVNFRMSLARDVNP